jgi:6-phosphofructokinase 2
MRADSQFPQRRLVTVCDRLLSPSESMKRILTLTINPAIDASCSVETVFPDHKLRSGPVYHEPGGGGVNVSRAIRNLGGDSTVFYLAGGPSGQMLGLLLDREGLQHEAIPIEDWTRENFTVTERTSGQQYRFVTPGPDLRAEEWKSCLEKIGSLDPMPDFIVASGSLPPGTPMDFYGRLAKVVSAKHSRFVLDSSGGALAEGLRSRSVYLVKPSMRELRVLVGRELVHENEQEEAAREIVKNGQAQIVVVSMGAAGALLVTVAGCKRITSPVVPVKSKVGAGDSMVAGVVLGLARDMPVGDAVSFGIACGAAAVVMPGTQLCRREDAERLFAQMTRG